MPKPGQTGRRRHYVFG